MAQAPPRTRMPRVEPLWTAAAAAQMLGLSERQVWRILWENPASFTTRRYGRTSAHPRKTRLLTNRDVEEVGRLRDKHVVVKFFPPKS